MAIGGNGNGICESNVVRLYSRRLYNEKVSLGGSESDRAAAYLLLARGYEKRLGDPGHRRSLSLKSSNSEEAINSASDGWEKAGDYADDSAKRPFYYMRALRFAIDLPEEDRKAKELRIGLKINKGSSSMPRMERGSAITDINAYRMGRKNKSLHLEGHLRT